jgi:hypothetical protein
MSEKVWVKATNVREEEVFKVQYTVGMDIDDLKLAIKQERKAREFMYDVSISSVFMGPDIYNLTARNPGEAVLNPGIVQNVGAKSINPYYFSLSGMDKGKLT